MMKNREKSFTLIELVISIVLISVFFTVVRINIQNKNDSLGLEEINNVYEILNNAKTVSIDRKKEVVLNFDSNKNSLSVDGLNYKVEDIKFKYISLDEDVKIVFSKSGIPSKGDTVHFKLNKRRYDITVRPATGFVDIKEKYE